MARFVLPNTTVLPVNLRPAGAGLREGCFHAPPWSGPNSVQVVLFNLERVTYWDTVSHYLDQKLRVTNHELRKITGISDTIKASRLLKVWTKQGFLEQIKGASPKLTYYRKPGAKLNTTLFA